MNRTTFETHFEIQLALTLRPADVVILDNLSSHKRGKSKAIFNARCAWSLSTPTYSLDLNPIKMAFAKLKARLRRTRARTIDAL
ncbi:DDE superfamily endonuclease [Sphingobium sp. AP50]|nr:DDE superfamily endonuclease [Sphingobium sp. AP50]